MSKYLSSRSLSFLLLSSYFRLYIHIVFFRLPSIFKPNEAVALRPGGFFNSRSINPSDDFLNSLICKDRCWNLIRINILHISRSPFLIEM